MDHVGDCDLRRFVTTKRMRHSTVEDLHNIAQNFLYRISLCWHCHQLPERSFFVKGRQMPLCARCTGILAGLVVFPVYVAHVGWIVAAVLVAAFAIDSATQLLGLRSSNNALRFITGMGFPVAVLGLLFGIVKWLWSTTL